MAYTKYSITPANNTAAPPDGAPEGMLPSAVNDTMRDMMAQIRDVGDGIRDGTYTMTAAKITGGTITGTTVTSNTFSSSGATITGGTINSTAIGGTTAAAGKFTTLEATGVTTVQAGTVSAPAITTSGDTNTGVFFPTADTAAITTGGTERVRVVSDGKVGIGVTSPSGLLHVRQGASSASVAGTNQILAENNGSVGVALVTPTANQGIIIHGTALDQHSSSIIFDGTSRYIAFQTVNGAERMRITGTGEVYIGTTGAPSGAASDVNFYTTKYIAAHGYASRSGTTGSFSTNLFNIHWTGSADLYIDTTNLGTIQTSSDYRIKKNVVTQSEPAIDKIMKLRPVTYEYANYGSLFKEDGIKRNGFIAHEVQDVIPSGAEGQKDEENRIQNLRLDSILSVAVKAIQELNDKVDAQAAEIAELKAKS